MKTRLLHMSSSDSGRGTSNHYRFVDSDIFSYTDAFTLVTFFCLGIFAVLKHLQDGCLLFWRAGGVRGLVTIVLCISQVLVCTISLGRSALSKIVC